MSRRMLDLQPITGKRLTNPQPIAGPAAIKERFLANHLPLFESPNDYEMINRTRESKQCVCPANIVIGSRPAIIGSVRTP